MQGMSSSPWSESPFEHTSCSPLSAQKVKKERSLKSSQMIVLSEGFQFHTRKTSVALQSVPLQACRANLPRKARQPLAGVALSQEQDSFRILNKRNGRQQVGVCCQSSGMCEAHSSVSLSMGSVRPFPWDQCITDSCFLSSTQGAVNGEQRNRGRRSLIQDSAFSSPDAATSLRRSET